MLLLVYTVTVVTVVSWARKRRATVVMGARVHGRGGTGVRKCAPCLLPYECRLKAEDKEIRSITNVSSGELNYI